ncbi:hypothetical protein EIN_177810 [Entamoeba invadens IP1]|uniref:hypothetical protein n=1 Tax=Entamoeba invadens IP1 TaxID=370355 RepID=UPI0002C3D8C7|nr:hypothetical protein EIN_177810 [Entamoeba invadens IP1]ELP93884.1 hypothetical protein EIN_177810 [Entamoeba invadens IP1]|eukprot:XP_004260655.1 hypothetical protein EIN_177810 [Entamoeba invadens IP1]
MLYKNILSKFHVKLSVQKTFKLLEVVFDVLTSEKGPLFVKYLKHNQTSIHQIRYCIKNSYVTLILCDYFEAYCDILSHFESANHYVNCLQCDATQIEYLNLLIQSWKVLSRLDFDLSCGRYECTLIQKIFYEQCTVYCKTLDSWTKLIGNLPLLEFNQIDTLRRSMKEIDVLRIDFFRILKSKLITKYFGTVPRQVYIQFTTLNCLLREKSDRLIINKSTKKIDSDIKKFNDQIQSDHCSNINKMITFVSFRYNNVYSRFVVVPEDEFNCNSMY